MKNYLIILIFLLTNNFSFSQIDLVQKANNYFVNENFTEAALMYEKSYFLSDNVNEKAILLEKKSDCLKYQNKIDEAFYTLDRINYNVITDSLKSNLYLKKAFLAFIAANYYKSTNYLFQFNQQFYDSLNLEYLLLKTLIYNSTENFEESKRYFDKYCEVSNIKINSDSIYTEFKLKKLKNPKLAKNLSYIFPGLGQIYTGNFLTGITNTIIIAAIITYTAYNITTQQYSAAAFSTATFFQVWIGGGKNATNLANEYNNNINFEFTNNIKHILTNNYNYEEY